MMSQLESQPLNINACPIGDSNYNYYAFIHFLFMRKVCDPGNQVRELLQQVLLVPGVSNRKRLGKTMEVDKPVLLGKPLIEKKKENRTIAD